MGKWYKKGDKNPHAVRNGKKGGRPTKAQEEAKKLAASLLKDYLELKLRSVADVYVALAIGKQSGKGSQRKLDPTTTRHFIERFIPPATKTINLVNETHAEEFFEKLQKEAEERKAAEKAGPVQIEPPTKKDGKTVH